MNFKGKGSWCVKMQDFGSEKENWWEWEFFGNSLGILWEFLGNSLGILWEFFGDVWLGVLIWKFYEFYHNSFEFLGNSFGILLEFLGILLEFFGDVCFGALNVWVLILGNFDLKWCNFWLKERQGQGRTTNQILRSALARSRLKRSDIFLHISLGLNSLPGSCVVLTWTTKYASSKVFA